MRSSAFAFTGLFLTGLLVSSSLQGLGRWGDVSHAQATCSPVSTASLMGHWTFQEGSGTTTADVSGNGHTGTLVGGTQWVGDSPVGGSPSSLRFDGSNDEVTVANSSDLRFGTGTFTVTLFARTNDGDRGVLGNFSANRGWGLYIHANDTVNFFGFGDQGVNDDAKPGTVLDNQWHHLAGVYTRSGASLQIATYVDGALVGTHTSTVGNITSTGSLRFGRFLGQPYFNGRLDEIRVYGRALTADEVDDLADGCGNASSSASSASSVSSMSSVSSLSSVSSAASSLSSVSSASSVSTSASSASSVSSACTPVSTANLAAYWRLDEGSGSLAHDSTSYDNAGSLLNGTAWSSTVAPLSFTNPHSLQFDGVNDYVHVEDASGVPGGSTARTVALWMNRNAITPQGTLVALGTENDGFQKFIVQMGTAGGQTYLFTDGVNGANNITLTGSQIPGVGWHHLAFAFDGVNQWRYYLDGVLTKSGSFTVPINTVTNDVQLGSRHDVVNGFYQGRLDDVRIYGRMLSASEVSRLAGGCNGPASSMSSASSRSSLSSASSRSSVSSQSSTSMSSASSQSSQSSSLAAGVPRCDGRSATIFVRNGRVVGGPLHGSTYRGILIGTDDDDVIVGTDADDIIRGRDGDDRLCGRGGDDYLHGNDDDDLLLGGPGEDRLRGGDGHDRLYGRDGSDELFGGDQRDLLCGRADSDFLQGGDGRDRLDGGTAFDYVRGGDSRDICANGESYDDCEQIVDDVSECNSDAY